MYQRRTHNRSQRFGGHTRHAKHCSCGAIVYGNGATNHFRTKGGWDYGDPREDHKPISEAMWASL
jgi:hypothetical protein